LRVWGDTYERAGDDLMAVETDIARQIASGVGGRLAPTEQRVLVTRATTNPEAYDHFLRGNYLLAQRTGAAVRRGLAEYETAVQLDPTFARAYGRIGSAYSLFLDWSWPWPGLTRDSMLARGFAAAGTALSLDSLSADAWMARGLLLTFRFPATYEGADQALRRALALDPRNAEAWHQYGSMLSYSSRDSASVDAFQHALALEPERVITLGDLSWLRYLERHFVEGRRLADSALAVDPQSDYVYAIRAQIDLAQGDSSRFRDDVAAAVRTRRPDYLLTSEYLVVLEDVQRGDTAGARARTRRLISQFQNPEHPVYFEAYSAALALTMVGDHDAAIAMLESVRPRGLVMGTYLRDPLFDPIRNDPRFQRLVAETRSQQGAP
jgi:tetratricopeptide (TPR) repeat protein